LMFMGVISLNGVGAGEAYFGVAELAGAVVGGGMTGRMPKVPSQMKPRRATIRKKPAT
jgi:hypothetical protein